MEAPKEPPSGKLADRAKSTRHTAWLEWFIYIYIYNKYDYATRRWGAAAIKKMVGQIIRPGTPTCSHQRTPSLTHDKAYGESIPDDNGHETTNTTTTMKKHQQWKNTPTLTPLLSSSSSSSINHHHCRMLTTQRDATPPDDNGRERRNDNTTVTAKHNINSNIKATGQEKWDGASVNSFHQATVRDRQSRLPWGVQRRPQKNSSPAPRPSSDIIVIFQHNTIASILPAKNPRVPEFLGWFGRIVGWKVEFPTLCVFSSSTTKFLFSFFPTFKNYRTR